jgi:hypothetical protein
VNDLVLAPGANIVPLVSNVNQSAVIDLITGPTAQYKNGLLPVDIAGNLIVYNGQEIPYFTAAVKATPLHVILNVGAALEAIGLNLTSLNGGG